MSLKSKKELEGSYVELTVAVEADAFNEACNAAFKKQQKNITVPGFRKGKATRSIVERMYGEGFFFEDAVNDTYQQALTAAIEEAELDVVSQRIDVEMVSVSKEEGYTFTAKVPVRPEVKIEGYKGIAAERLISVVTDEQVDAELENVRKRNARTTVIDDRGAQNGDKAVFDFAGSVDGVPFEGGTAENYELVLGSGQFIPGFEDQMLGHSVGEEFDVNVTFPEEYHAPELAGKAAVFAIKLHSLSVEELPELDDDFAMDVSDCDTLEAYRESLRAEILERVQKQNQNKCDNDLLRQLAELVEADIPEEMYEDNIDHELEQWAYRLQSQGISLEDYVRYTGMTMDMLRGQFKPQAVIQVKIRLALETIAKLEGCEATEEEIEAEYKRIADLYTMDVDSVKAALAQEDIARDIVVEKAVGIVRDNAVITDVEKLTEAEEEPAEEAEEADTEE